MKQLTDQEYEKLLREAQAPWQQDGHGIRGVQTPFITPDLPGLRSSTTPGYRNPDRIVIRSPVTDPVTGGLTPPPTPPPPPADINTYSFKMVDATGDPNNPIKPPGRAILIYDGQVSDSTGIPQFPTGMGNDDFYLQVGGDGYVVWCEITYDTTLLTITSSNINQGPTIPESTLGDTFVKLGDISIESDGTLTPHNTQCGDINIAFLYGALNGAPGLYLLSQIDVPQALTP